MRFVPRRPSGEQRDAAAPDRAPGRARPQGRHVFSVRATDGAGNSAAANATWDIRQPSTPSVTLLPAPGGGGGGGGGAVAAAAARAPFRVSVTWSTPVTGFTAAGLELLGPPAAVSEWAADPGGAAYSALLTPAADGLLRVGVAPGAAADAAGVPSAGAPEALAVRYDATAPAAVVLAPAGLQDAPFNVTVAWSEPVTGFAASLLLLEGAPARVAPAAPPPQRGSAAAASRSAGETTGEHVFTITPLGAGALSVRVPAGAALDAAGNANAEGAAVVVPCAPGTIFVADRASGQARPPARTPLAASARPPALRACMQADAAGAQNQAHPA